MSEYMETRLWKISIGAKTREKPCERLRTVYDGFRERAKKLAEGISKDLKGFTVHDITHLDALWDVADTVVGKKIKLNPAEGFVLGGAFLIHDLGMTINAYEGGIDEIKQSDKWKDSVTSLYRRWHEKDPTDVELINPEQGIFQAALSQVLRQNHAEQAEKLMDMSWKNEDGDEYYLIEDKELRKHYGPTIARIAHSHWWSIEKLEDEFSTPLGAFANFPKDWTVDTLKLACILRVADACHIDARRAPPFLRCLLNPTGESLKHWKFQENLSKPILQGEKISYTSGKPFKVDEADAWWLCFDTLTWVDTELRDVDILLEKKKCERFAAKGIAGIESPNAIKKYIQTRDWIPVDTNIRVGDVASLVQKLGGEKLYVDDPTVPLRELIQNAADAIRARRILENRPDDWGDVTVRLGEDEEGHWIEVEDNGKGMSEEVLTGPFLDFGTTYWGSDLMIKEHPGLASDKDFQSTGEYGIGFFSVFMWGDHVKITSWKKDDDKSNTKVLEFKSGLKFRPILRRAKASEQIQEFGSRVRIWFREVSVLKKVLKDPYLIMEGHQNMSRLCEFLCPTIDMNLYVEEYNVKKKKVIHANDWKYMDGAKFITRIMGPSKTIFKEDFINDSYTIDEYPLEKDLLVTLGNNLRIIKDEQGNAVGRACIERGYNIFTITVGGFRSNDGYRKFMRKGISGVLLGKSISVDRNKASPLVKYKNLKVWASEQASLIPSLVKDPQERALCGSVVYQCGASTKGLPIAYSKRGWENERNIMNQYKSCKEILLFRNIDRIMDIELNNNTLGILFDIPGFLISILETENRVTVFKKIINLSSPIEALAKAWGTSTEEIHKVSHYQDHEQFILREIGYKGNKPINASVGIIRNPKYFKPDKPEKSKKSKKKKK